MPQTPARSWLPHVLIIAGFLLVSVFFSYPILQGKVLEQHDIVSWMGMSHEAKTWHDKTGEDGSLRMFVAAVLYAAPLTARLKQSLVCQIRSDQSVLPV